MMPAAVHTCPSCAAAVEVASKASQFATCKQCGCFLFLESANQANALSLPKAEPGTHLLVQMGSTGQWQGKDFELIGRACCFTDDGPINFWTMLLADGQTRLLYEQRGLLLCLLPLPNFEAAARDLLTRTGVNDMLSVNVGEENYRLQKKMKSESMTLEGEGLLPDMDGRFTAYHLQSKEGSYLMAIYTGLKNSILAYEATAVQPAALSLAPATIAPVPDATLHCLKCYKPILLKAARHSASCACSHCGSQFRITAAGLSNQHKDDVFTKGVLALHSQGTIEGITYTVCGAAEKGDPEGYRWREYTLFSQQQGFAWLSEYDGHWTFLRERLQAPVVDNLQDVFIYEGERYELFNKYHFITYATIGEFSDVIFDKKTCKVKEYIAPPYIWVQENDADNKTWLKGRHIDKKELTQAFGDIGWPYKKGVGAVQPDLFKGQAKWFYRIMAAAVLLFLLAHTFMAATCLNRMVVQERYVLPDSLFGKQQVIMAPSFELTKASSNLRIDMEAPVSNDWFELAIELTNLDNGKEYGIEKGVEYYSGYEGGDSWSEGSNKAEAWFSSLPKGRYSMELRPARSAASVKEFALTVTNDVPMDRNIVAMTIILAIIGALGWFYSRSFENSRWQNSPFGNDE